MTKDELRNHTELHVLAAGKKSVLRIEEENGVHSVFGTISLEGDSHSIYWHPIGPSLLKKLEANQDGAIQTDYKALTDNIHELRG